MGGKMPIEEFVQAEKWLQKDSLVRVLLKQSYFNEKTLKATLFHYWGEGVTFEDIAEALHIQQPGAWKRWRRSLDTIMRSFYTLELAMYAGVLDPEIVDIVSQDLQDYASLAREEGGLEEIQSRIEERMLKLKKIMPSGRGATP